MVERKSFAPVYGAYDLNEVAIHREAFGWTAINFDSNRVYMQRDTENINNLKILEFEKDYNYALEKYRIYDKKLKDENFIIVLYLILIIPLIYFYIRKKNASNQRLLYMNKMLEAVNNANNTK